MQNCRAHEIDQLCHQDCPLSVFIQNLVVRLDKQPWNCRKSAKMGGNPKFGPTKNNWWTSKDGSREIVLYSEWIKAYKTYGWYHFRGFITTQQNARKQTHIKIQFYNRNIARIANADQVTICLLVSTSVYKCLLVSTNLNLNRCLCSHCSHCSQCLLVSTSVY